MEWDGWVGLEVGGFRVGGVGVGSCMDGWEWMDGLVGLGVV